MQTQADNNRVLTGKHFMLGNYAVVEGALAAGCDFFAGYPITPANEISERMAARMPEVGGRFLQGEDELCSIYALTGASLAGAKAMTATASAGFNYMQEGIGYAVAAEIPLVIVDVQRCRGDNYATQSDVMQMRWAASGDYEMIVLAPSSVQELFEHTIKAFNLAERYRTPVIVMSETTIALMRENLVIPDPKDIEIVNRARPNVPPKEFVPFKADPDGIPPLPDLGEGYRILHSLNPHDEWGGISWDPDVFEVMYERIIGKITCHRDDIVETQGFFLDDAEIVLIAYGSESRPALDAVDQAREDGIKAGLLKLVTVWPVPEKEIRAVAEHASVILAVEMNIGKYAGEIERASGGCCEVVWVTKNRGEIHTPAEIYAAIEEVVE
ncbi:2-oxoacid:acceptor oxidoreductase subunit alpha [Candidatus Bipolaricaulota bacterium]|nr:2-oxoacid:acceptor oxidoreductase subunit alpha [Candidatus Bipolaricaulota bacterium]